MFVVGLYAILSGGTRARFHEVKYSLTRLRHTSAAISNHQLGIDHVIQILIIIRLSQEDIGSFK
jgi:hypothetical protein